MISEWMITVLGFVAALLTTFSFIPQFIKIVSVKNVKGLSFWMMLQMFFGLALWTIYGFLRNDIVIIIANIVGSIIVFFTIIAYIMYRKRV